MNSPIHPPMEDVEWQIGEHVDGLFVKKDQEVTSEFLDELADERFCSKAPAGEYHKIASIPVVVVEKWLREGFDLWHAPAKDILKKLKSEDLGGFLASNKSV